MTALPWVNQAPGDTPNNLSLPLPRLLLQLHRPYPNLAEREREGEERREGGRGEESDHVQLRTSCLSDALWRQTSLSSSPERLQSLICFFPTTEYLVESSQSVLVIRTGYRSYYEILTRRTSPLQMYHGEHPDQTNRSRTAWTPGEGGEDSPEHGAVGAELTPPSPRLVSARGRPGREHQSHRATLVTACPPR